MESRNKKRNFGERLKYLFYLEGIDIEKRGSLYHYLEKPICDYFRIDKEGEQGDKPIRDKVGYIKKHIEMDDKEGIGIIWLRFYQYLFNCSFDYLEGLIDQPTYEKQDIFETTGLESIAIDTLKEIKEYPNFIVGFNQLSFLNELLKYNVEFSLILKGIYDFIHSKYKYPVHFEKQKWVSNKTELENIYDTPLVTLASSYDTPCDNIQYSIDETFLESVAIEEIRKCLLGIKETINNPET